MPDEEFDPFRLESGLIDDCDVAVKDAQFGYRSDYNDGQTLLWVAECLIDGDDGPEEQELIYSCGAGWDMEGKGAKAIREDGKKRGFNKNSAYGLFIKHALDSGAADEMRNSGKTPMDAGLFVGFVFHMKRIAFEYGGEIGSRERLLPVEFKGIAGSKNGSQAATVGASGSQPTSVSSGSSDVDVAGARDEASASGQASGASGGLGALRVKLTKLAKEVKAAGGSHDTFAEKAFEIAGVEGNGEAENAVMDDGAGSIWAKAEVGT